MKDPSDPERANEIGAILTNVVRLSRVMGAPRSTPFGDLVLTRTQLEILFMIAHAGQPVTPGHLAETLKVTPGAITQTVDQLRSSSLVEQVTAPHDGRARVLRLTAKAAARVEAFEAAMIDEAVPWFAGLSGKELAELGTLLSRIRQLA